MMDKRNATPPPPAAGGSVLTPEEIRRIELNRLKGIYQLRGRPCSLTLFYHSKSKAEATRARGKLLVDAKCEPETPSRSGPSCVHFTDSAQATEARFTPWEVF